MAAEEHNRGPERGPGRDARQWQRRMRDALAQVEQERDDAVVYLSAIKRVLDVIAKGHGTRQSGQEIAEVLLHELAIEACAIALREGLTAELVLMGFATQAQRFGGAQDELGEAGWLTLAQLVGPGTEPVCFRRTPDGGFGAVSAGELLEEGFVVLPFLVGGAPGGVLVLHSLLAPAQVFARGRALALLAEISGQALATARTRESIERLCGDLEGELGTTRRALSAHEENIGALTQALIRSNRVKREFLGTVSHELRTPLSAIMGYAGLVRDGAAGPIGSEQAALLDRVLSNSRSLNALIDDMLFVVQLEADRITVQRERVLAAELVAEVLATIPHAPDRQGVRVHVDIAPTVATLTVDPALLRRLLFHLVSNALKFTTRGEIAITIAAGADPDGAMVTVRDTGVGIPSDRIADVFELFAQGDSSTTRRYNGLGMGLTLVQRCVHLLGGEVEVESRPGAGSEFRVSLPRVRAGADDAAQDAGSHIVH